MDAKIEHEISVITKKYCKNNVAEKCMKFDLEIFATQLLVLYRNEFKKAEKRNYKPEEVKHG